MEKYQIVIHEGGEQYRAMEYISRDNVKILRTNENYRFTNTYYRPAQVWYYEDEGRGTQTLVKEYSTLEDMIIDNPQFFLN